jgi:hypothetical protein
MIEGDTCDGDRARRRDDVRRVEATAEPDFENCEVYLGLAEREEGGERRGLEKRELGCAVEDERRVSDQCIVRKRAAVDLDALGEAREVRGR